MAFDIPPPMASMRRKTISHVDEAVGSITGIVPEAVVRPVVVDPDELPRARRRRARASPRRSKDAQSQVTMTPALPGNALAGSSRSEPGSSAAHRGGSSGSFGKLTVVDTPRDLQEVCEPQHRAEGVGVGIHVTGERHLLGVGQHGRGGAPVRRSLGLLRAVHLGQQLVDPFGPPGGRCPPRRSSSGRNFSRTSRPSAERRWGVAERSAARVPARSFSSPRPCSRPTRA